MRTLLIYDLNSYKRSLNGWLLELVEDPTKAKEIIDSVDEYGKACYRQAVDDYRRETLDAAARLRDHE